jgi:uncharacterized protein YkwD
VALLALFGSPAAAPAAESRHLGPSATTETVADATYLAPSDTCPGADSAGASGSAQRRAMTCLVNYARRARGVHTLRLSTQLTGAGNVKLSDNDRCDEFSHTACGLPFLSAFRRSGYVHAGVRYSVGENLAYGAGSDGAPRRILSAWLDSSEHRANLFDPTWREMGVSRRPDARFIGFRGVTLWANEFGVRANG